MALPPSRAIDEQCFKSWDDVANRLGPLDRAFESQVTPSAIGAGFHEPGNQPTAVVGLIQRDREHDFLQLLRHPITHPTSNSLSGARGCDATFATIREALCATANLKRLAKLGLHHRDSSWAAATLGLVFATAFCFISAAARWLSPGTTIISRPACAGH
ncbi:MAG: hypothetical protein GY811_29680 [Myxococcales bacterium]|nr:hypothetical protein [Myxococcales bacterium]